MRTNFVVMKGISKRFGAVVALDKVDFKMDHGEVLGLVGDNAAGKSTLMKILSGKYQPDSGNIIIEDQQKRFTGPIEARRF